MHPPKKRDLKENCHAFLVSLYKAKKYVSHQWMSPNNASVFFFFLPQITKAEFEMTTQKDRTGSSSKKGQKNHILPSDKQQLYLK